MNLTVLYTKCIIAVERAMQPRGERKALEKTTERSSKGPPSAHPAVFLLQDTEPTHEGGA